MSTTQTESQILANTYEQKRKNGLLDVKFYIKNGELKENVCAEINRLDLAKERGEFKPLVFGKTRQQPDC